MRQQGLNVHVARRLFDVLTDCEIAHCLTGVRHYDYLASKRKHMRGQFGREMDRILGLGPEKIVDWMQVFLNEFREWME